MTKTFLVLLLVLGSLFTRRSCTIDQELVSRSYGKFEISYPADWHVVTEADPTFITSLPPEQLIHGVGLQPLPGMWINIAEGICNKKSDDFVDSGSLSGLEKTICISNFQVTVGLWSDDPDKNAHKKLLDKIVNTFKVYKVSRLHLVPSPTEGLFCLTVFLTLVLSNHELFIENRDPP